MTLTDAIVPVAGHGTRLLPLTRAVPKELLPVGRLPVLGHVVDELRANGIRRVLMVTAARKEAIAIHLDGAAEAEGLELSFVLQHEQRGLGDAVLLGAGFAADRPVAVALGDCLLGDGVARASVLTRLHDALAAHDAVAAVAVQDVPRELTGRYGVIAPADPDAEVLMLKGMVEKPDPADAPSTLAVAARYVLGPEVFAVLGRTAPGRGGEVQLTDALATLVATGHRVVAVRLAPGEDRRDVGGFASYAQAFAAVALADPELGPALRAALDG